MKQPKIPHIIPTKLAVIRALGTHGKDNCSIISVMEDDYLDKINNKFRLV